MSGHEDDGGACVAEDRTDGGDWAWSGSGSEVGRGRIQTLPLNSRRLTAPIMRQLAGRLGVPINASQADLCPMIEGKLTKADRDPTPKSCCVGLHRERTEAFKMRQNWRTCHIPAPHRLKQKKVGNLMSQKKPSLC